MRQKDLRTSLLGQIELAGVQEKNTLRQWKKIIASITHPRLVYVLSVYYSILSVYYHSILLVYYRFYNCIFLGEYGVKTSHAHFAGSLIQLKVHQE